MGNTAAKSKEPVFVTLGKTWYTGGEELTGVVKMDIRKPGGYSCKSVGLKIKGEENTVVEYTEVRRSGSGSNRSTHTSTHLAKETRSIISVDVKMAAFNGIIPNGQHEFPFSAKIPPAVPSSFNIRKGRDTCAVQYVVQAIVWPADGNKPSVFGESPVNIRMLPRSTPRQRGFVPPTTMLVRWNGCPCQSPNDGICCFARCCPCFAHWCLSGTMTMGGSIGNNVLSHGEQVECNFAIENDSGKRISALTTNIVETISWSAQKHYTQSIVTVVAEGKSAHDVGQRNATVAEGQHNPHQMGMQARAEQQVMERLKSGGDGETTLELVPDAYDSYKGHLVNITHRYTVQGVTDSSSWSDPSASVQVYCQGAGHSGPVSGGYAINQYAPTAVVSQQPIADDSWNPVEKRQSFSVPMEQAVHGGVAFAVDPNARYIDVMPNPAAGGKTIATLMAELEGSYDDIGTITAFCDDDTTDAELRSMTPAQFGAVVTAVAFSLDQPKAASMLARGIGPNLRCGHVVAVMMKTAQGNPARVDIVKELAPQCSDLSTNKSTITSLLSEFEKMLVDVL